MGWVDGGGWFGYKRVYAHVAESREYEWEWGDAGDADGWCGAVFRL